jgi:hypothetical protein
MSEAEREPLRSPEPPADEAARQWQAAREAERRGDFDTALAELERLAALPHASTPALASARRELEERRRAFLRLKDEMDEALERKHWRQAVHLADQMLAVAPEHGAARQARQRAWKSAQPATLPAAAAQAAVEPGPACSPEDLPRRLLLWIDGVGGFLVCLSPRVSIGQAANEAAVDVPLYADVSRLHAYIVRDAEGYVLEAIRPVSVNGHNLERAALRDGDILRLGDGCDLEFRQPVGVSATARLAVTGRRLPLALDGVLLMAESLIVGPGRDAHLVVPELTRNVILARRPEGLALIAAGPFTIDGRAGHNRTPVQPHATLAADDFRLTLEPVGPHLAGATV